MKKIQCSFLFFLLFWAFSCVNVNKDVKSNSKLKATLTDFLYNENPITKNDIIITGNSSNDIIQIRYTSYSTVEKLLFYAKITPQTDNPVIWIGRDHYVNGYTCPSAAMKIDGSDIIIYRLNSTLDDYEIHEKLTLPFNLLANHTYLLSVEKTDALNLTYRIISADTEFSVTYNKIEIEASCRRAAIAWGTPFLGVIHGSVKVNDLLLSSNYDITTKLLITGDSFIEGATMLEYGLENRWCALLSECIGANQTVINGQGGAAINQAYINRFKVENAWFNAPYVIISLGTNNYGNVEGYKSDMQQLVNYLKANNQTPILVTCTPRPGADYNTTVKVINDWVKASGELYIDMHKAVTDPNDPSKWKADYVQSDGVHPSTKGHAAMFRQVMIDCPILLAI